MRFILTFSVCVMCALSAASAASAGELARCAALISAVTRADPLTDAERIQAFMTELQAASSDAAIIAAWRYEFNRARLVSADLYDDAKKLPTYLRTNQRWRAQRDTFLSRIRNFNKDSTQEQSDGRSRSSAGSIFSMAEQIKGLQIGLVYTDTFLVDMPGALESIQEVANTSYWGLQTRQLASSMLIDRQIKKAAESEDDRLNTILHNAEVLSKFKLELKDWHARHGSKPTDGIIKVSRHLAPSQVYEAYFYLHAIRTLADDLSQDQTHELDVLMMILQDMVNSKKDSSVADYRAAYEESHDLIEMLSIESFDFSRIQKNIQLAIDAKDIRTLFQWMQRVPSKAVIDHESDLVEAFRPILNQEWLDSLSLADRLLVLETFENHVITKYLKHHRLVVEVLTALDRRFVGSKAAEMALKNSKRQIEFLEKLLVEIQKFSSVE